MAKAPLSVPFAPHFTSDVRGIKSVFIPHQVLLWHRLRVPQFQLLLTLFVISHRATGWKLALRFGCLCRFYRSGTRMTRMPEKDAVSQNLSENINKNVLTTVWRDAQPLDLCAERAWNHSVCARIFHFQWVDFFKKGIWRMRSLGGTMRKIIGAMCLLILNYYVQSL